ncbi:MAG: DEAD/DEAH box helicase [Bacteroidales bacterium]|nr:DEAD/DEAH box helicase [Bacteroidales bacterium]
MKQLKAGFFTNGIESLKTNEDISNKVDLLIEHLCYFDLDCSFELNDKSADPAIALIYNIISRGTPTYASQFIEDILSTTIGKTLKRFGEDGTIYREIQKQDVKDAVFKALHIIDPRITDTIPLYGDDKEVLINDFIFNGAVSYFGNYISQIAEKGRCFQDIFKYSKKNKYDINNLKSDNNFDFLNDKADLSFSVPYSNNTADCVIFSFDPSVSNIDYTDYIKEEKISEILKTINVDGKTIIKRNYNLEEKIEPLSAFTQSEYFDILRQNYESPLYNTEDGIEALQIALTPPAVARIQKVILEAINSGILNLDAKCWNICVIERDVPCAFLALKDLAQHFDKFYQLENAKRKFPKYQLNIFYTPEFENTELNLLYQGFREDVAEFDPNMEYDLLIDISMLQRCGLEYHKPQTAAKHFAIIRSSKSPKSDTKLLFDNRITYNIKIEKEDDDDYDEQEDALNFFLKNLFAKNEFLPTQQQSIIELLNGKNLLHVSEPASGKTLIALYSALMKPGYSYFLSPTISVMKMQFEMLRNRKIDIDYYISPVLENTYDRLCATNYITEGLSQITFISPSLLHDNYIRNVFNQINEKDIPIYYLFVDEAQRISTQTPDFRSYYQDIKNVIANNKKYNNTYQIRIGAFTSCQESNVINEIKDKLETDTVIHYEQNITKIPQIVVHEICDESTNNQTEADNYFKKIKQQKTENILSNNQNLNTIIFGAETPYSPQNSEKEPTKLLDLPTNFYLGDVDEKYDEVLNSDATISRKSLKEFCQGKNNYLVAKNSAGIGIHANNLEQIIYFEPPFSLDEFNRMNGRANNGMVKKVDVLLNTTEQEFSGFESLRDEKGNLKTAENIFVTNYDTAYNLKRLSKLYPGPEKEKIIMHEILNGIYSPQKSGRETICQAVYNEFGIEIETETEPTINPYQLYIFANNREKSFGYINFKTDKLVMPENSFDIPLAEKIQTYIYYLIIDNTTNALEYLANMQDTEKAEENDGLQNIVDLIKTNESSNIIIPFNNSKFEDVATLLNSNLKTNISANDLLRIYSKSNSLAEFEKILIKNFDIRSKNLEESAHSKLANLYLEFRNRRDTIRAITSLKEIDLIDDYLINSAKGEIIVYVTKHDIDFYKMKLLPILLRNLTRDKSLAYIASIDNDNYLNIEKITNVLIDFFYSEIYPLYEKSIEDCNKFFKTILDKQKDNSLTQEIIANNLSNYFISRYKCKFIYDMPDNIQNMANILGILDLTGSNIGEMKHLEESVSQDIPENRTPANKIICGYCKLFTSKGENQSNERFKAYSLICDGLNQYRALNNQSIDTFKADAQAITDKITKENYDLKDEMETVMKLKIQSEWLKRFNSEILKLS